MDWLSGTDTYGQLCSGTAAQQQAAQLVSCICSVCASTCGGGGCTAAVEAAPETACGSCTTQMALTQCFNQFNACQ
jgi:hypothetical protein